MSLAAAWSCDSSAQAQVTKMLSFFDSGGGASGVKTGYTLSGGSLGGQVAKLANAGERVAPT
eukprot:4837077-Prymnesium_polylepis.1